MKTECALSGPDDRIIHETGVEAHVATIIEPVMQAMDFRLVRVRITGQNGKTLQIFAEKTDGTMTVEDCEELSRAISPALDVDDPIEGAYNLEVSSPGIDRPLVAKSDFRNWESHLAKIETSVILSGRRKFRGFIQSVTDQGFTLKRDTLGYGDEAEVEIPFDTVSDARLILTDDLIRDALSKERAARKARKKGLDGDNDNEDTADSADE
ncbi:ribosome maturation factor RimP [Notoacmeibacter sp. MSK16QG-6]|uniref:ribosome maturation factor RimP n=1 Tax=Notoacmeibacter sp. MSK16QG-6 TaxID=2957982 RepID=UPI00209F9B26|nr:ribosome maturation factor RimP [Notoacmeibacter sp. MSK16QG-6]MCP1198798.1 ribosome maturation factor RimP [Notoacmeibacter sp. MSK16QG-6]